MTQGTVTVSVKNTDKSSMKSQVRKCLWCNTPLNKQISQNLCKDCQKGVENEWTQLIANSIIKERIAAT
jgi:hypothetical protein